ncbi:unnamed protein product [Prunus armeniaca]|uniref:Uncharacterized protein n=1 Tax=Prunus armeniaca TaxID=36596 RepID=A0A6J5VHB3_PRUAR|nr:unnamed protein product [Prunus armeniaca]
MAGIVVVFDFDRTLIDGDSDSWVVAEMGLTQLFNELRSTSPWNKLMDRMMKELHLQGKSSVDIKECLKRIPMHLGVIAAIKSAHASGCDLRIISDANQFFIETILECHGLLGCFSQIVTNPSFVDGDGRLGIFPYHDVGSPSHGCNLCPPNLCKGVVIDQIRASVSANGRKRYIYLGDGRNDFCPTLRLVEGDHVMPRKDYALSKRIYSNRMLIKADVHEWSDGEELGKILLHLIHRISTEEINCSDLSQLNSPDHI